jgi:hypothetical protein
MTPSDGYVVDAPTFAGTIVVAGHSPTKSTSTGCLDWWQIHHARDEASRVAAPSPTASNWTTAIGADRAVVTAHYKKAGANPVKCISAVGAEFENASVEADTRINVRGFKIEAVPERQLRAAAFKERKGHRV